MDEIDFHSLKLMAVVKGCGLSRYEVEAMQLSCFNVVAGRACREIEDERRSRVRFAGGWFVLADALERPESGPNSTFRQARAFE